MFPQPFLRKVIEEMTEKMTPKDWLCSSEDNVKTEQNIKPCELTRQDSYNHPKMEGVKKEVD